MAVLEQITQMKSQGMPTGQIIQSLKQQGITPKEINEALSQSEIKNELNKSPQSPQGNLNPSTSQPAFPTDQQPHQELGLPQSIDTQNPSLPEPQIQPPINQQMNQGVMPTQEPSIQSQQPPIQDIQPPQMQQSMPQMQESQMPSIQETPMQPSIQEPPLTQEPYPEYSPESPESYDYNQYPEYSAPQATDVETINDLASQIVDERMQKIKKEITEFVKISKNTNDKIKDMEIKIEKIENSLGELQISLIRKMGDYGEDIKNISNEVKATQDSFSKVINPLMDEAREKSKTSGSIKTEKQSDSKSSKRKTSTKKSTSFEDYLR